MQRSGYGKLKSIIKSDKNRSRPVENGQLIVAERRSANSLRIDCSCAMMTCKDQRSHYNRLRSNYRLQRSKIKPQTSRGRRSWRCGRACWGRAEAGPSARATRRIWKRSKIKDKPTNYDQRSNYSDQRSNYKPRPGSQLGKAVLGQISALLGFVQLGLQSIRDQRSNYNLEKIKED